MRLVRTCNELKNNALIVKLFEFFSHQSHNIIYPRIILSILGLQYIYFAYQFLT